MNQEIIERVLMEAKHINQTHDTIRKTAKIYGLSKSTVHNDIAKKLKHIDMPLFLQTRVILRQNFSEKHLRGGQSTKEKYLKEKEIERGL